ncbi:ATP-binding cassette domain-containing protein [Rhodobacteraceae bacterium W635]|uniref:ABC transporter ATP-binding protein n=1 Tax=Nioella halotolerans TaxID=2303578 RepID=UPI000E3E6F24|nr:ATP-binding cassette domain-containing protein [Rhodobacteraceae bacterium W635]
MSGLTLATISHSFGLRRVLDTVSMVIRPGELVALVGPSGCGKSTLAAIAGGILKPDQGRIVRQYQRHGMVFQQSRLLPWASARENIAYPLTLAAMNRAQITERTLAAVQAVALLSDDLDKLPAQLSGGMRARVAIARALVVEPEFLIFDEPFAALDPALRRRMQDLVLSLAHTRGFGGLFITHDLTEAALLSHRIAVMDRHGKGILGSLTPPDTPGQRSEAQIFEFTQAARSDPMLYDLVNVDERAVTLDCACDTLGFQRCC